MYKVKMSQQKGFTLIEMVTVLALVSLVAVALISFSIPAISQFSCAQKAKSVAMALERARHAAQFLGQGNVVFDLTSAGEFDQSEIVPVALSSEIVFEENSGRLVFEGSDPGDPHENVRVDIGGGVVGCTKTIIVTPEGSFL